MINTTNLEGRKKVCTVWQEQSQIPFNAYDAKTDATVQTTFKEFAGGLEKQLMGERGIVVVNGGHYIPSLENPNAIAKNAYQTWDMACRTAKELTGKGIDARVSLMINDLPLTPEERMRAKYEIPADFAKIAQENGVKILNTSSDSSRPYAEKRCSNKFSIQEERQRINPYPEKIKEHCVAAIIFYLRDIKKQGATQSVWITPKCSHKNMLAALGLYQKYEGGVGNKCYFETPNCFE